MTGPFFVPIFAYIFCPLLKNDLKDIIQKAFSTREILSKAELASILQTCSAPGIHPNTLSWKIHDLKQKGIIHQRARDLYAWGKEKESWSPTITPSSRELYGTVQHKWPCNSFCLTETNWLNEFMPQPPPAAWLILEVEKNVTTTVLSFLTDAAPGVFPDATPGTLPDAAPGTFPGTAPGAFLNSILVKPLISGSPFEIQEGLTRPSLEKMLVDILCDTDIYRQQSHLADSIITAAAEKYRINGTRIRQYARRRDQEETITRLLGKYA